MAITTRPSEVHWRKAHGAAWVMKYAASSFGPTRMRLARALQAVAPFESVLDLGCNCGVLVPWLASASPHAKVTGVDVNREALTEADRCWPHHTWVHGSIVDWLPEQTEAWDVIVSSSCLEHVAPTEIGAVLHEMARLASKAIVLQEVTTDGGAELRTASIGIPEWRHDYRRRLSALGWHCAAWEALGDDPTRPAAVMTFTRTRS